MMMTLRTTKFFAALLFLATPLYAKEFDAAIHEESNDRTRSLRGISNSRGPLVFTSCRDTPAVADSLSLGECDCEYRNDSGNHFWGGGCVITKVPTKNNKPLTNAVCECIQNTPWSCCGMVKIYAWNWIVFSAVETARAAKRTRSAKLEWIF